MKNHDLRNFENESELENFYCWEESLSPPATISEVIDSDDSTEEVQEDEQQTTSNAVIDARKGQIEPVFDSLYRQHPYLPPFVKNHPAVEKYTENQLAALEADKKRLNLHYTSESLYYHKLVELLEQDIVPIDLSPFRVTEVVVKNERLTNDDVLDTLCWIYDLCIKNKVCTKK